MVQSALAETFKNDVLLMNFSFDHFNEKNAIKYENIPKLCDKLKVEKNLINPNYLS